MLYQDNSPHMEGPVYDKTEFEGMLSLKSMNSDPKSRGGLQFRLLSNLFHLIRNRRDRRT